MIYGKLPVVFLSTIASEKNGSTNCVIATYILEHLDEMKDIGIKEIAKKCNVAVSSISRFCKEIGLRDFVELKELLSSIDLYFEEQSHSQSLNQRIEDYSYKINESIQMVKNTIDRRQLMKLCDDINLQGDLLMLGKQVYTHISYTQQMQYIITSDENDLIIIFSYTGSYFDYQNFRALKKKLNTPKIWMISGDKKNYPSFVDEVISFESLQDQASHPYQLQFIASLIAQEYSKIYRH